MRNLLWAMFVALVMGLAIHSLSSAQGLQSSPYAVAPLLRRDGLGLAPSNSSDRQYTNRPFLTEPENLLSGTSSQKDIPNLQAGYVYYSGKKLRVGYFTLDYILPIRLAENSIVFGAAHSELQGSSTTLTRRADDQVYLSMGGGYRTILRKTHLLGFHCFYDTARFADQWVSSGGAGFEVALLMPGHDALDMNFNWYGDLAEGDLVNQFRDGPANFDLQMGYSHQLFDRGPDLRLFGTAYKFDDGSGVYGWQAGAELKSPNGVVSLKCETAYDPVNDSYQSASAFVNIGFQLENLVRGKNPFVMPEPIFSSPRNMNRLTEKVKRNWRHTMHGVLRASNNLQTITVVNNRTEAVKLYMGVSGPIYWGNYSAKDFQPYGFEVAAKDNPPCNLAGQVLYRTLQPGEQVVISFDPSKGPISPAFSADMCPWGDCPQTLGEFTLKKDNKDTIDISLVNGFKYPMEITTSRGGPEISIAKVEHEKDNQQNINVFPLSCDNCTHADSPPTWTHCQQQPFDQTQCKKQKSGAATHIGDPPCQTGYPMGANYTVYIR